jgi:YbbR domain-containing protein
MEWLRAFVRRNLLFKIMALLLAIVIWTMVNRTINSPGSAVSLPEEPRTLHNLSVLVLGRATVQGDVLLKPELVNVTVKGLPNEVRRFAPSQLTLYLDISNLTGKGRYRQKVQYSINAGGVQVDRISPPVIEVELR